jgi:hypothetical protein
VSVCPVGRLPNRKDAYVIMCTAIVHDQTVIIFTSPFKANRDRITSLKLPLKGGGGSVNRLWIGLRSLDIQKLTCFCMLVIYLSIR